MIFIKETVFKTNIGYSTYYMISQIVSNDHIYFLYKSIDNTSFISKTDKNINEIERIHLSFDAGFIYNIAGEIVPLNFGADALYEYNGNMFIVGLGEATSKVYIHNGLMEDNKICIHKFDSETDDYISNSNGEYIFIYAYKKLSLISETHSYLYTYNMATGAITTMRNLTCDDKLYLNGNIFSTGGKIFLVGEAKKANSVFLCEFSLSGQLLESRKLNFFSKKYSRMQRAGGRVLAKTSLLLWGYAAVTDFAKNAEWWLTSYNVKTGEVQEVSVTPPRFGAPFPSIGAVAVLADGSLCVCTSLILFILDKDFVVKKFWHLGRDDAAWIFHHVVEMADGKLLVSGTLSAKGMGDQAAAWLVDIKNFINVS